MEAAKTTLEKCNFFKYDTIDISSVNLKLKKK